METGERAAPKLGQGPLVLTGHQVLVSRHGGRVGTDQLSSLLLGGTPGSLEKLLITSGHSQDPRVSGNRRDPRWAIFRLTKKRR